MNSSLIQRSWDLFSAAEQTVELKAPKLIVIAHPREAEVFLSEGVDVFVSGWGKVDAAVNLTKRLMESPVSEIHVYGTAGAIDSAVKPGELYEISEAIEYDSERENHYRVYSGHSHLPLARIATGDRFLTDELVKSSLREQEIHLVDMESSVYCHVAQKFSIPLRIFKYVSDEANEEAETLWEEQALENSRRLLNFYREALIAEDSIPESSTGVLPGEQREV